VIFSRVASVAICTECIVAKRCVLEQKLLLTAYSVASVWRGGSMVSVRDSRSEGREFDPRPRHTA